jgi:hypothetical protein
MIVAYGHYHESTWPFINAGSHQAIQLGIPVVPLLIDAV